MLLSTRTDFVLLQQFLGMGKDWLVDERRHRNLNPFLAGPFVIGAIARGHAACRRASAAGVSPAVGWPRASFRSTRLLDKRDCAASPRPSSAPTARPACASARAGH